MLYQGHMVAPLYRCTNQVGPRFGNLGLLVEWKQCHYVMFEADIHLRPPHTSMLDIYKCLSYWYAVSRAYGCTLIPLHTGHVGPRLGDSGSLVEWQWCDYVVFQANIHLRLLHTSIFDIYKMFEPLVLCSLKCIWLHPYTVTLSKFAPYLGILGHLWSKNNVIMSCLRLMSTSDHLIHPY